MVGKRIKLTRIEKDLSQVELANKVNISKQTLYKYENEIITNIPIDKISDIAKALNVSPGYLMGWTENIRIDMKKLNKENQEKMYEYFELLLNSQKGE